MVFVHIWSSKFICVLVLTLLFSALQCSLTEVEVSKENKNAKRLINEGTLKNIRSCSDLQSSYHSNESTENAVSKHEVNLSPNDRNDLSQSSSSPLVHAPINVHTSEYQRRMLEASVLKTPNLPSEGRNIDILHPLPQYILASDKSDGNQSHLLVLPLQYTGIPQDQRIKTDFGIILKGDKNRDDLKRLASYKNMLAKSRYNVAKKGDVKVLNEESNPSSKIVGKSIEQALQERLHESVNPNWALDRYPLQRSNVQNQPPLRVPQYIFLGANKELNETPGNKSLQQVQEAIDSIKKTRQIATESRLACVLLYRSVLGNDMFRVAKEHHCDAECEREVEMMDVSNIINFQASLPSVCGILKKTLEDNSRQSQVNPSDQTTTEWAQTCMRESDESIKETLRIQSLLEVLKIMISRDGSGTYIYLVNNLLRAISKLPLEKDTYFVLDALSEIHFFLSTLPIYWNLTENDSVTLNNVNNRLHHAISLLSRGATTDMGITGYNPTKISLIDVQEELLRVDITLTTRFQVLDSNNKTQNVEESFQMTYKSSPTPKIESNVPITLPRRIVQENSQRLKRNLKYLTNESTGFLHTLSKNIVKQLENNFITMHQVVQRLRSMVEMRNNLTTFNNKDKRTCLREIIPKLKQAVAQVNVRGNILKRLLERRMTNRNNDTLRMVQPRLLKNITSELRWGNLPHLLHSSRTDGSPLLKKIEKRGGRVKSVLGRLRDKSLLLGQGFSAIDTIHQRQTNYNGSPLKTLLNRGGVKRLFNSAIIRHQEVDVNNVVDTLYNYIERLDTLLTRSLQGDCAAQDAVTTARDKRSLATSTASKDISKPSVCFQRNTAVQKIRNELVYVQKLLDIGSRLLLASDPETILYLAHETNNTVMVCN